MWLHNIKRLIQASESGTVEGIYRVQKVKWNKQHLGEGRILLLSDSSSELEVLLPNQTINNWLKEKLPYQILLSIHAHQDQSLPIVDPLSIHPALEYNPITLISKDATPKPEGIIKLIGLYKSLQTESIKLFWQDVFTDEIWLKLFLKLPASRDCHHAFPGGLFIHSLEVADLTQATLAKTNNITALERDAAMTIALLHDATKVISAVGYPARWKNPFMPWQHDRNLPYFLSSALLQLQERDVDAWATIIRMLDDFSRPKETQNSPIPALIKNSDHLSAHLEGRYSQRQRSEKYRNWTKVCGRPTWTPSNENTSYD